MNLSRYGKTTADEIFVETRRARAIVLRVCLRLERVDFNSFPVRGRPGINAPVVVDICIVSQQIRSHSSYSDGSMQSLCRDLLHN